VWNWIELQNARCNSKDNYCSLEHCLTFQTDHNIMTRSALVTTLLLCIRDAHRSNTGPDTDCPAPACGLPQPLYQNAGSVFKFYHNETSSPFWSVTIRQSSETLKWITASLNKLQINTTVHVFDTSRRASSHSHLRTQMDSISETLLSIPTLYNISKQSFRLPQIIPSCAPTHSITSEMITLFNIHHHKNLKMFMMNTDWQCKSTA
jgi:hypothetical protein